jgi:hypothetical protein
MNMKLSTLDFTLRQRPCVKSLNGTFQSERNYLDFVIDGRSLIDLVRYDLVSVLCREWVSEEREKSVRRLLREAQADFPNDRRSILVCGECGDIARGFVSVIVDFSDEAVVWKDFGYQNTYEPEIHGDHLKDSGPFQFGLEGYRKNLIQALGTLNVSL